MSTPDYSLTQEEFDLFYEAASLKAGLEEKDLVTGEILYPPTEQGLLRLVKDYGKMLVDPVAAQVFINQVKTAQKAARKVELEAELAEME